MHARDDRDGYGVVLAGCLQLCRHRITAGAQSSPRFAFARVTHASYVASHRSSHVSGAMPARHDPVTAHQARARAFVGGASSRGAAPEGGADATAGAAPESAGAAAMGARLTGGPAEAGSRFMAGETAADSRATAGGDVATGAW
jgi:hypothetical protein